MENSFNENRYKADMSGGLFDVLIAENELKNDAALARFLKVQPPIISKIRHGRARITAELLIHFYDRLRDNGAPWGFDRLRAAVPTITASEAEASTTPTAA